MRSQDEEALWVEKAQRGDSESFGLLFDSYYAMIHSFAYRVCLSEADADDLAQETFIRAAGGISGYLGKASFKNWLYTIAHHVLTDWVRRVSRQRTGNEAFASEMNGQGQARPADYHEVHAALLQLAPDLREAVALVFFDDLNHREAAKVMGCAETTVSWRIFRAKRLLKHELQKSQEGIGIHER